MLFLPPGILPRDGRNISFREISARVQATYNFSPSFSVYVPRFIAKILNRSYDTGRLDLSDIDVHNGIEHDASLVRKCYVQSPLALSVPIKLVNTAHHGPRAYLMFVDRA